jgi:hypothetical protein
VVVTVPAESNLGIFIVLVTVEPHPAAGVDTTDISPLAAKDKLKVT